MLCLFLQMEWEQERRSVSISLVRPYKDVNTEAYFQARFMSSHGGYHLNSASYHCTSSDPCFVFLFPAEHKFYNAYGTPFARLARDWSIYSNDPLSGSRRSILMKIASPLLFYVPDMHLKCLSESFVDGLASVGALGPFLTRIRREWESGVLFVSILVGVR